MAFNINRNSASVAGYLNAKWEPSRAQSHTCNAQLIKVNHLNIILPLIAMSPTWAHLYRFFKLKLCMHFSFFPYALHGPSIPSLSGRLREKIWRMEGMAKQTLFSR
jgi:hypothetical protein